MKKFFPVFVLIFAFSAFLAGQIFFEMIDTRAGQFGRSAEKHSLYENLFRELSLEATDGTVYELKNTKAPIVVLNFWASWCQPCLKEFPSIVELKNKFSDDELLVIGINNDEENASKMISKIQKEYKLNFKSVIDSDSTITSKFLISEIPVSIIYIDGKVYDVRHGESDFVSGKFISKVSKVLSNKKTATR